jgi:hypothetical protein
MTDYALYKDFAHHYFGVIYDSYDAYCANYKAYMCHSAHSCPNEDCYFAHSDKELMRAICMNFYNGRCDRRDCRFSHKQSLPTLPISLDRKIHKLLKVQKAIEGEETYLNNKKRKLCDTEGKLTITEDKLTITEDKLTITEDKLTYIEDKLCDALDKIENMQDVIQTLREQNMSLILQNNELTLQKNAMKAEFDNKLNMLSASVNNVIGNLYAQVQAQAQLTQRAVMPKPPPQMSSEQPILTQSVINHYQQLLTQAQKK